MISTRLFCGSRTPAPIGTSRWVWPKPRMAMARGRLEQNTLGLQPAANILVTRRDHAGGARLATDAGRRPPERPFMASGGQAAVWL
jgi:hypothetical protein